MLEIAALVMRVCESGEASHLTAIAKLPPGEELHDVQLRAVDADAQELVELAYLGNGWIIGDLEQHAALFLERPDPGRVAEHGLPFTLEPHAEERGQRRAVPEACRHEMGGQLLNARQRYALAGQETFDPVRVTTTIAPSEQKLAMHLAPILFGEGRHVDDAPDPLLAAGALPSFEDSQLANTIGVAVGVTCRTRDGRMALLQRRRAKNVAVYQNMWATPFGFGMAIGQDLADGSYDLRELISLDYGHEFAQELGLEHDAFSPPRAVALCRDLPRGGKPQFFFEIKTDYALEDIAELVGKRSMEYSSTIRRLDRVDPEDDGNEVSPELTCFVALIGSDRGLDAVSSRGHR